MVGQIKTVNGVKKIVPLTAEARAGNPVSTIIAIYSNLVPYGYLPCNGVQFDETQFPALYAILGDNHTPDLRECALVGAGQNATDTIATHDVYNIGQFKDDQLQNHTHDLRMNSANLYASGTANNGYFYNSSPITDTINTENCRHGDVTRGKRKGVNYCIKATAGLDESDADYVLGVLAPVDEVTVNNMHSVTSNAVAEAIACVEVASSDTNWLIQKLGNGKYIATGWNKSSGIYSSGSNPIKFSIPTGYKLSKVLNGNAFAQGNVMNVTQAIHAINDYNIRMYVASGDYSVGDMRIQCILIDD